MSNTAQMPADHPANLAVHCLAVTEHAPLPMATIEGPRRTVRYANPAFCTLLKKTITELVGTPLCELLPEKDECLSLIDRVAHNKRAESYTEQDLTKPHP